jgi:quercetin dioxygenase-like cupin family protein
MSTRDPNAIQADLLGIQDETAPVAPRPALRDAVLRSMSPAGALAGLAARIAAFFDVPAARGLELARAALRAGEAPWVNARLTPDADLPGVRFFHLTGGPRVAQSDCGLVQVAPGGRFPRHVHEGDEYCFVLAGAAEEEGTGVVWRAGDVAHRLAGSAHSFRVVSPGPYVFAVILDGLVRLVGAGE